jgi:DUF1680 family protein
MMTRREMIGSGIALVPVLRAQAPRGRAGGILCLDQSPYAKLRNIPVRAVKMGDGFWAPRRKVNVEKSIPTLLELLEEHGAVDNFRRLTGRTRAARRGPRYTDSDVYKWMEAAAFVLQSGDDPQLRAAFDRLAGEILAAQEPSGYLNTYFVDERVANRFKQMVGGHELYCLGHLLQAAIAYYRATGGRRLLDGGIKFVDYLCRDFGPTKQPLLTGHPELEMALVELYRTTGERRYLELAGYLLQGDGERLKLTREQLVYLFSGKPFVSRTRLEGHAVRAMYACCGATDYYMETGDAGYWRTLELLWNDMAGRKMYITGGVGSRAEGEAFGEAYELPNVSAYTESCAAIGNLMWNWRMLAATGAARYTDVIERALYNGVNSGLSLEGSLYCYRNPLELAGDPEDKIRNPWYDTTCCPPNLERILASLPGYMYSTSPDGLYVHLYHSSELDWALQNGAKLKVTQKTNYPWEGKVEIGVDPAAAGEFTVFVRVPGWTRGPGSGRARRVLPNPPPLAGGRPHRARFRHERAADRGEPARARGRGQSGGRARPTHLLLGRHRPEGDRFPVRRLARAGRGPGHGVLLRIPGGPARRRAGAQAQRCGFRQAVVAGAALPAVRAAQAVARNRADLHPLLRVRQPRDNTHAGVGAVPLVRAAEGFQRPEVFERVFGMPENIKVAVVRADAEPSGFGAVPLIDDLFHTVFALAEREAERPLAGLIPRIALHPDSHDCSIRAARVIHPRRFNPE